jgi:NitT/TauT family transport system substrate-binding protein
MTLTRSAWICGSAAGAATLGVRTPAGAQTAALNVAAGLIAPQAQAYFAADQGLFAKHGITATVSTFRGGAANAAAVASGAMQIGVSSVLQLAQARNHGLPFVILVPAGIHDSRVSISGLLVAASSPFKSAKDLSGKIVGASSLSGLDELATRALIDKAGGDSSTVKFTEIPPSAQLAALTQGRIDAANMEDPERQAAIDGGTMRNLGDGEDAIAKLFVETAWFATTDWLGANKDTARRFSAAIYDAGAWAEQNPAKAADVLAKVLKTTPTVTRQRYASSSRPGDYQSLLDVAATYKFIQPTPASTLVWDGA